MPRQRTPKELAIWKIKLQPYFRTLKELHADILKLAKELKAHK